jgi:hypothetical protein
MGDIKRVTVPVAEEAPRRVESTIPPPPSRWLAAEDPEVQALSGDGSGFAKWLPEAPVPPTEIEATDGPWVALRRTKAALDAFEAKHPTLVYLVADIRKALES